MNSTIRYSVFDHFSRTEYIRYSVFGQILLFGPTLSHSHLPTLNITPGHWVFLVIMDQLHWICAGSENEFRSETSTWLHLCCGTQTSPNQERARVPSANHSSSVCFVCHLDIRAKNKCRKKFLPNSKKMFLSLIKQKMTKKHTKNIFIKEYFFWILQHFSEPCLSVSAEWEYRQQQTVNADDSDIRLTLRIVWLAISDTARTIENNLSCVVGIFSDERMWDSL